jgi:hypothetical protein
MPEFVPSGYLSIREALEGCELFPSAWTGEEHKARRGFIESIIQEILGPLTPRGRPSQARGHGRPPPPLRKAVSQQLGAVKLAADTP